MVPKILALDFDGVLCDGLLEYFQASWRTYCQIWNTDSQEPPEDIAPKFYRLRPVIETGWEMPVLVRALILEIPEEKILQDWSTVAKEIVESEQLNAANTGKKLDLNRDEWISSDLDSWLSLHRFYPGVIEQVNQILSENSTELFIVTTKEGRFAKQLLQQQGVQLPEDRIIGKECKRPKYQTLRQIIENLSEEAANLWFVEDRLKTLQLVQQQPDLKDVKLFLADWGYNTVAHQELVRNDPSIQLLALDNFNQDFSLWP
ncbi:MAG: HAD hydrolase-like protein [Symploca sp. SIO2D2]|nr:HAD hydrolase-like protein [Symploca sp. SIO2D2]